MDLGEEVRRRIRFHRCNHNNPKVVLTGISDISTTETLRDYFSNFGKVIYVRLPEEHTEDNQRVAILGVCCGQTLQRIIVHDAHIVDQSIVRADLFYRNAKSGSSAKTKGNTN